MNQCVPSWDLDDNPATPRIALHAHSNSSNHVPSSLDYEVAELTWENGQLAMHRLGLPRVVNKPAAGSTWEKPSSGGTLESIVNQAKWHPHAKYTSRESLSELVPWFNHQRTVIDPAASSGCATMTMDALVPCNKPEQPTLVLDSAPRTCGFSTTVDGGDRDGHLGISGRKTSASESATCGGEDNRQLTLDTCDLGGAAFTSTSPENTSSSKEYTCDDSDSVYHIRFRSQRKGGNREHKKKGIIGKSSASTKRSRAAASHNQSERKRRDKINQRMNILQKMVPNSSKIDKASMLDEVIEYLKQLQAQVHMMSRMCMPSMMLPLAMQQQQLQMSMMGMGTVMGMNPAATMPPAAHFMPISWDNLGDRLAPRAIPDPMSTFLTCQSQTMSHVDAYARLAVMYQQLQQNHWSGPRN